jgi:hypothetical protein
MNRILVEERFKTGALGTVLTDLVQAKRTANPSLPDLARAEALVRLRLAEEATRRKSPEEADSEATMAEQNLRGSLTLNPADSFLWLMLYSTQTTRKGFDPETVGYLDQSYATAPLDAWIALRRNRLALAIFPLMSEVLRERVVSEFTGLVDSGFTEDAAINLTGVGWEQRDRLLTSLASVNVIPREALAKRLARDGVKASVPGVEIDERLWR